ncbi:368_t:CDS:2, partial [Cetraspora pellucida]
MPLIATILDPRMKNFSFANSFDPIGENVEEHLANLNNVSTEDIFAKIWGNDQIQDDEVTRYLCYPDEPKNIDPLIWWKGHQ